MKYGVTLYGIVGDGLGYIGNQGGQRTVKSFKEERAS